MEDVIDFIHAAYALCGKNHHWFIVVSQAPNLTPMQRKELYANNTCVDAISSIQLGNNSHEILLRQRWIIQKTEMESDKKEGCKRYAIGKMGILLGNSTP